MNNATQHQAKLKASTLVEILVALSIVSIIFVIGSMVWANLNKYNSPASKQKIRLVSRELLTDFRLFGPPQKEQQKIDGLNYHIDYIELNENTNLYEVTITAFSPSEDILLERQQIIRTDAP